MKRILGLVKKKEQPPSGTSALPSPPGAYELQEKDLGKLHRGAASGNLAQVRKGLKKHGIDGRDKAERTALHLACANGHVDVVTYLVENKCKLNLFDSDNRTPLMKAVQCQQEKCVTILLKHGADPNLEDVDGNTALHLAVLSPSISVAEMLIIHDANLDAQNKEGYTPLSLAVSEHHEEVVGFLLREGADVDARDDRGRTPLMIAASDGNHNLVKVLRHYGAVVSHKDFNGWTAEDYAVSHGHTSLGKQLAQHEDWKYTGEASAGGPKGIMVLNTPHWAGASGFMWGAPAMDRGGMQQSPNQTSRTGKSRKAIDDFSQGDSRRSGKAGSNDTSHTSEEELHFTRKKQPKPNLVELMKAYQEFKKTDDDHGSGIESHKSPKRSPKQTPSDANLNKGECGELLNQDVSDASDQEEEELEEGEDDDETDSEDEEEDYEEEEEGEEEDNEDLSQDEKEEEDLEDEETQSNDILEEDKTEPKEINQKLEGFGNAKYKGEDQCGTGDVCDDDEISKELGEKVEESVDTPVSFIAGSYESLQENIIAMSPKIMNNEVSCKSVPKQAVFQNLNNLQDTQESWNRKSLIQEKFHRNADSGITDLKKEIPQPLSDSCGPKEKKSNFGSSFESGNNSWSAAKKTKLESRRVNSVTLECVDDEDTEEEQYEEVDDKVCEALKQEGGKLHLHRCEENLGAVFCSSTKEESPEQKEEDEEQQKEGTVEELQTAVVEGVKSSVSKDNHQVHNASKDNTGVMPVVKPKVEEELFSPWISEDESPEQKEGDKEQQKEGTGVVPQTAVVEGVKSSVSKDNHQVHNASKDNTGERSALPAVGANAEEVDSSPWDSEDESPEQKEGDKEQQKEGTGVVPQTAVVEGVKSSVSKDNHQVHNASKDNTGERSALPAVGANAEEVDSSPWDSEDESPEQKEGDKEQQKEGTGVVPQTAVVEGVKSSVSKDNHQVHNASKDNTGERSALPAVGANAEEVDSSPWDSEDESPEQKEGDKEQQKEGTGVVPQTAVVEGVKSSVSKDNHQVHNASKDNTGERSALPAMGAKVEEDVFSPSNSESVHVDSENLTKVSAGVFLPGADRHEAYSQIVSDFSEKPSSSQLKTPESILEKNETSPKKRQQKSDPLEEFGLGDAENIEGEYSGCTFHISSSAEKEDNKDATPDDGVQDKCILETTNLIEKATHENQTDKAEISHRKALAENEESNSADKQFSPKPWEERYERLWVENEKRELKTNFKNITAELKQLFGEINETGKPTSLKEEMSKDGFSEELKNSCFVSSRATESSNKLGSESGDTKLTLGGKVPKMEIVIPSLGVLPGQNNLNENMEDTWSTDEEENTNDTDNIKVPLTKGEERKMPVMEMEVSVNRSSRHVVGGPECSLRHGLKTSLLDDISHILPKIRPVSTSDENELFVTERKLEKDSGFNDGFPRDCLNDSNKVGETEMESLFANAQQSCGMLEGKLDEELKQDMERFKSKVGMLQKVFLALEKEKVQLQKEVEEERTKQRCFKMQAVTKQEDLDKLNTPPGNVSDQQMKQKLTVKKNDCLKTENENTIEEKDKKNFVPEKRSKLVKMLTKGIFAMNIKVAKKNKRQTSKQKANQMSNSSGNHFQVLDDRTFSENPRDKGRPPAKRVSEKNKVSMQMDVTDDFDSSDTTSEDVESPTSTYQEAMLLLEQLSVGHAGSPVLLKMQNILLKYEQIIKREKNRRTAVWREVRKLESEKEESQLIAEETQDLKSVLAHQEVEWKSDIQSLKFTLKQEEEKRLRLKMLHEKTKEKLRRKDDEHCKEMEEKQQLELHSRNLEMELKTLRKRLKQVEEERDETQRQLSQEKSARALQEGILNNHLWRRKELEEERRTIGKKSDESDTEREKDLLYKNQLLQDEIAMLRLELDQVRLRHQEEERKYLEENETLKEKNEDLKKELKLNEEALTQTAFQYNGQLNLLKTESAVLTSKLEQTKESKDRLETEIESFRSRLNTAVQELERHQSSKSDVERTFQRERDEWLRLQDKLRRDLSDVQETNKSLLQQLSKAESKTNSLENELHQLKQTLREKRLLLEMTQKELSQAQCQAKEYDHARQLEKDRVNKFLVKQESMQERLAQLQSENVLLRQQLEDTQNKGMIKEKVVNDVQDRFNDIFNKLRADTEKQVCLVEERNKELNAKCTELREQVFKYEADKVEREGMVRQLQQELADALKKQSMSEASLEVSTRYRSDLEEDKLRLQKELEKVKTKLWELEEQHLQSERCVHDLKTTLDNKEREVIASSQKLQDLLLASSGANTTIKQLEEHVQRLEIENARLEATVQQQSNRIEALQRDLQASTSVHNRLEDLITGLRTTQAAAGDHQHQMQKQNVLGLASKDLHSIWEEQLKSRSHLEERVAQLDREKAELLEQCEGERKKVKKLLESKRLVELRLDEEMKTNIELQKDVKRLKSILSRAKKKLRMCQEKESQLPLQEEMKNRYSEMVNEVGRLKAKVAELSQQLETESKKCMQLEAQNEDLQEELSTMHRNHEKLEKSKSHLKEEVANLKHRLETNMVDHSQMEQYKRQMEDRASQEIRQKLQEVNLFLQAQAASQDRLEQIRASHHASLRNQLKDRIRDLECELDRIRNTQQDNIYQKESTQAEAERYKELYLEEEKRRKSLANKLERTNEKLAEANAKLLQERHRSRSLITSRMVSGGLAPSPVLYSTELGHLGNNLALNRSLSLGGTFLSPTVNALASSSRVEAFVARVRQELDEKITKELEQATAELEIGSAGASSRVSTDGSSQNFHADQDPLSRAVQEYRDVLTKNYMI